MNNCLKMLLLIVSTTAVQSKAFSAEECLLKVGWMERPSYQYADRAGRPQGFDIDYIKALAKDLKCEIKLLKMPWKRQDGEMLEGNIDILLGARGARGVKNTSKVIIVSDGYRQDPIGFYIRKDSLPLVQVKNLTELMATDFKLGVVAHDFRTDELASLMKSARTKRKIHLVKGIKGLLRNLDKGLIQGVLLHSAEIDYLRSKNNPYVKDIVLVPNLSFTDDVYLISGTKSEFGSRRMKDINQSILQLKKSGLVEILMRKHVPSHFEIIK